MRRTESFVAVNDYEINLENCINNEYNTLKS
jgi:hypothetical protein